MKKILKKIGWFLLVWVWQLPQTLIGCVLWHKAKKDMRPGLSDAEVRQIKRVEGMNGVKLLIVSAESKMAHRFWSLVSGFGMSVYILLTDMHDRITIRHEFGHVKWSAILGPLFLPVMGVISAARNVYQRICQKDWCYFDWCVWYYIRGALAYVERWADAAGKVDRLGWLAQIERPDNARYPAIKTGR